MNTTEKGLVPVHQKEVSELESQIQDIVITDDKSLAQASDIVKNVKTLYKEIDSEKKEFTRPADEITSAAKAKYDPSLKILKGVETTIKEKVSAYLTAKAKKAKDSIEKLGSRVEKGTMRMDTAMRKMDEVDTSKEVKTESSGMRMSTHKDVIYVPLEDIPADKLKELIDGGYIVWDKVKARKDGLSGIEIPGVSVVEVSRVSSF